ncbi:hypothetical protein COCMIDRAFT_10014 [Bipolaris oryzae ATCC 44560]|uniref:Prion-inhibition and propagation HeLo domain-containing protein n=1 Tax=Bipolaris oryzae ATCC 44560 TaxID=930090 RepID=W6YQW3_COCMI|nr:uncharacterized protein COCMIDRAFT_10014 [Bipolaris oryzae ATCC 44560]EUC40025.1 hypothetical protein COCMIDRAFT_10014 [Bipolaris oryzae ATCC 44560]
MTAVFQLRVGTVDLIDKFNAIIYAFENTKPGKTIEETLQLEILKLRLCRWCDAIVQLAVTTNETPEGADTVIFGSYLDFIHTLAQGTETSPSTALMNASGDRDPADFWLIQTLQDVAEAHRGLSRQPSSTPGRSKGAIPKPVLMMAKVQVDQLEVIGLQAKLSQLRLADAEAFKTHRQVCEQDIGLLKRCAMAVDPEFGKMLRLGGDSYANIEVRDKAIGHYGHNIRSGERVESVAYSGITAGGESITHFGHTIGNFKGKTVFDGIQKTDK